MRLREKKFRLTSEYNLVLLTAKAKKLAKFNTITQVFRISISREEFRRRGIGP